MDSFCQLFDRASVEAPSVKPPLGLIRQAFGAYCSRFTASSGPGVSDLEYKRNMNRVFSYAVLVNYSIYALREPAPVVA